jgi:hypothetical protein
VQAQIDNANALQAQINKPASEEGNPASTVAAEVVAEQVQSAPVQEQVQAQAPTQDATYWRHRFDVLQGKYNAEIPALRQEIKTLTQKLAEQSTEGSAVQRAQTAMQELTPAEIEEYGPDLVNLIKKVAGSIAGKSDNFDDVKAEVAQMRDERHQDAYARFMTDLEVQLPNWREINADPAFLEWLSGTDMLSGAQRQQLLTDAEKARDAYRVVAIFKSFGGKPAVKQEIPAELVQPKQSRATVTDVTGQKTWSRDEISKFYRERSSMTPSEASAIEADIFAAQSQGRIR